MDRYYLIKVRLLFIAFITFAIPAIYAKNINICDYYCEINQLKEYRDTNSLFGDAIYAQIFNRPKLTSNFFLNKLEVKIAKIDDQKQQLLMQSIQNNYIFKNLLNNKIIDKKQGWFDQLFDAKKGYFENNWQLFMFGDMDTTNINNKKNLNFAGLVGYTPNSAKHFTFYVGYRYLYQAYPGHTDDKIFIWDTRLFGPLFAVAIRF